MPYQIDWYIKDEIIYTYFSGIVTHDDLRESSIKTFQMIESSPRALVHHIADSGDVVKSISLKDLVNVVREVGHHPRVGWSFSIRQKAGLPKMMAAIGTSIFKMRYRSFDTLEETLKFLKDFDQTISWDKSNESFVRQLVP